MHLPDPDHASLTALFRLADDMEVDLGAERRHLAELVERTRSVVGLEGCESRLVANLRTEIFAQLDWRAQDLEHRQRAVLTLVDTAVSSYHGADPIVADGVDPWAPPWEPPALAATGNDGFPIRLPVSLQDRRRRRLAQILTLAGAVLVVCGLLLGVL
jgi:hypothetical protein